MAAHRVLSGFILIILLGLGYWGYGTLSDTSETRYIVTNVQTGTIVASVSGTGQVAAQSQVDIKPQAAGTIISVPVKNGQRVAAGQLIAQLDASTAQKAVRDAQVSLESAQLSLAKLQQDADSLSITQAKNDVTNADDALMQSYADGYDDVVSAFLALPSLMTDLEDIVIGTNASRGVQWNIDYYRDSVQNWDNNAIYYRDDVYADFRAAEIAYSAALTAYRASSVTDDAAKMTALIEKSYEALQTIHKSLSSANSYIRFYSDQNIAHSQTPSTVATNALADLATHLGTTNSHLASLRSDVLSFKTNEQQVVVTREKLADLEAGADPLDLRSAQLSVEQRENALRDAREQLADYSVRAPFAGTIATLDARVGLSASSGSSLATLVTAQEVAEVSLNEVDIAKVTVGAKATLSFDAIEDLTITGKVAEIDTVGTVSQGVVSYTVTIAFDTHDARIKPGMSVSAAIVTDVRRDVVIAPNEAVKSRSGSYYVLAFETPLAGTDAELAAGIASTIAPQEIPVEIGIADDERTEIISGLEDGAQIVTKTITVSAESGSAQAPSIFSSLGGGARVPGATGGARVPTGTR